MNCMLAFAVLAVGTLGLVLVGLGLSVVRDEFEGLIGKAAGFGVLVMGCIMLAVVSLAVLKAAGIQVITC